MEAASTASQLNNTTHTHTITITMEFALPQAIQSAIIAYDPTLKKVARETNKVTRATKRSPYPLGNVNDLIPTDIVPARGQQLAADHINKAEISERLYTFSNSDGLLAFIYHYESIWIASWFTNDPESYYGVSFAFKDDAKAGVARNKLSLLLKEDVSEEITCKKYGKSDFIVGKVVVRKKDIEFGKKTAELWNPFQLCYYKKKQVEICNRIIKPFRDALIRKIPTWLDSQNIWERVNKTTNSYKFVLTNQRSFLKKDGTWEDFIPNADNTIDHIIDNLFYGCSILGENEKVYRNKVRALLNKPAIYRFIQQCCDEVISKFNDPSVESKASIGVGWKRAERFAEWVKIILVYWPDTPVDHFRNNIDLFWKIEPGSLKWFKAETTRKWITNNMSVESFIGIVKKNYEKRIEHMLKNQSDNERNIDASVDFFRMTVCSELADTFEMIHQVICNKVELVPPKRWRIEEFHNHVQSEAWKIKNPNVALPQDLFPAPIKINHEGQAWTFFQPIDTHQLSTWGRAVRNCVGSASSYAEGVKRKQHFIVLCMIDGKPRFTIQLKVNSGVMHVQQITDVNNARLSPDEQSVYTKAFGLALDEVNKMLTCQP